MSNSLMASFDRGSGIATGSLAAQTRMVSVVGFAPERTGVITNFKYLARTRIFEFEVQHIKESVHCDLKVTSATEVGMPIEVPP